MEKSQVGGGGQPGFGAAATSTMSAKQLLSIACQVLKYPGSTCSPEHRGVQGSTRKTDAAVTGGQASNRSNRVAKCDISTNSKTNFYLDEEDKLHERGEQGENVEKSEVESFPRQTQRPAYFRQLPEEMISLDWKCR